jgi:hypothetical protein
VFYSWLGVSTAELVTGRHTSDRQHARCACSALLKTRGIGVLVGRLICRSPVDLVDASIKGLLGVGLPRIIVNHQSTPVIRNVMLAGV